MSSNNGTCFDSFGAVQILKENKKFKGRKNIMANYYRVQA